MFQQRRQRLLLRVRTFPSPHLFLVQLQPLQSLGRQRLRCTLAAGPVVDTTGCGDAYQAAFLVSWFASRDIARAMKAGAEAASEVLTHLGAV